MELLIMKYPAGKAQKPVALLLEGVSPTLHVVVLLFQPVVEANALA
jgi:hypothetical protein